MSEKLKRILTGVQSTGVPHLGNILGAIIPAINFSKKENIETFLFIADFHSLTQIKNSEELKRNTLSTAAAWLACGLNPDKTYKNGSKTPICRRTARSIREESFIQ